MEQKIDRLYSSAPLENSDLEKRTENIKHDVNSFNISVNNIKGVITYIKTKIRNQKRDIKIIRL